ncbi:DUF4270 family protein [Dyadobacter fanqingshengii]|uniref:DUF4270 domain-containing protein n=1 Tax=Dyadobacter fanqingshengii TaxID=2906443 RepID=A0A9X1PCQ9_9BACT|nr:DUF4270 family protein [Dyadobacter fanqingshengii]MCF0042566.1 DUF4270 domain-containing protein [Dyadobacter fanqingshengii]USJ36206.1 DUF4270 domain-containing protein [Dyadobacter fanqingshengii]
MKFNSHFLKRSSTVFRLLIIWGVTASLTGCEPSGDEIEAIVQPDVDDFAVQFSDTSTVTLSSLAADSVMTGGPSRLLVGRNIDPYFGKYQATAFFQPTIDNAIVVPQLAVYDSLTLSLQYDNYAHGDTTVAMNIAVHKLLEDMTTKRAYYNSNSTPYEAAALGKKRVVPTPRSSGKLSIRLSDKLGKQIFDMGKGNLLPSNTEWIDLIKGLALIPGATDNGPVIGFTLSNDNTSIQLHYHLTGDDGITKDSTVIKTNTGYNQILGDRKGTQLAKLPTTSRLSLPSAQSGNMSFIQSGLAVVTRVDLPTIKELKLNPYTVVNKAFLRVSPLKASVTNFYPAPSTLYAYLVDKNNEYYLGAEGFPEPLRNLRGEIITANYRVDLLNNTAYYEFDLSGYLTTVLAASGDNTTGILLRTSPFNTEFDRSVPDYNTEFSKSAARLVIGDQRNSDPGIKLRLYYTSVNVR